MWVVMVSGEIEDGVFIVVRITPMLMGQVWVRVW